MARGVPISGVTRAQSSGAGALVTMYLGIEIPMSFSPLSIGAGVGPKEATNIGLFAARPSRNLRHSASVLKTFSLRPMSQAMVVAWLAGFAITILSFHFGSARSS